MVERVSTSEGQQGEVPQQAQQEGQGGKEIVQQMQLQVWDHVRTVWGLPRPGMRGVKDAGGGEEDSSSNSEESSSSGDEECGDKGSDEEGEGGEEKEGAISAGPSSSARARQGEEGQQRLASSSAGPGPAAKGGVAQAAATLSKPNLAKKQHFSFDFAL